MDELLGVDARAVEATGGSIPALEMLGQQQELDEEQDGGGHSHEGRVVADQALQGKGLELGLKTDEPHESSGNLQADVARTNVSGLRVADLGRW